MQRIYPSNAARSGSGTLTGGGSTNDIFTFSLPVQAVVQNNTTATIYVYYGQGTSAAATQGDEAIAAGTELTGLEQTNFVAIYGAAGTAVNGTAKGGIVVYGLVS